ncbi:antiterminator LoaP [Hazenella coriacea]|uniref:Transcriptional antiterminator NusG n=1 Tax=Hazenella coriacea TaxID=1179467 RepID=A0A4V2UUY8_9BACL|nr:antiterminator LoaP [Hazenella coriacea]TCS93657.1 transcriptional antiterminator NusG [Hazenella coriacea]
MCWYALFVETGKEHLTEKLLKKFFDSKTLTCFVPKRLVPEKKDGIVHDHVKVMFPGYIFIHTNIISKLYYSIRQIPKIYYIVKCGKYKRNSSDGYYSIISQNEMSLIIKLTAKNGILDYSDINIKNKQVEVISGPLMGMESIIKKVDRRKRRAKVEIEFLDKKRMIDVGVNILSVF